MGRWGGGIKGRSGAGLILAPYVHVVGVDVVPPHPVDVGLRRQADPGVVICRGQRSEVMIGRGVGGVRQWAVPQPPTGQDVAVAVLAPVVGVVGAVSRHLHLQRAGLHLLETQARSFFMKKTLITLCSCVINNNTHIYTCARTQTHAHTQPSSHDHNRWW